MSNNLKPKIRFKGFTDTWEQRKLGDFGKSTGGVSIESEFIKDGKYKVISIGSYSENSTYNDQGIRCRLSNRTKERILNKDDITIILNDKTASGNIIGRALLIDRSDLYVYNQRTERLEINKEKYNPQFIYQLLNAPNIREKIIKESQGNTQIYVNWTRIKELLYYIPTLKEQRRIGIYLKQIDNLITLHQRKYDKLVDIKKALLEKMFPKNNSNIPEIRFKGFTDTWEQRKLGDFGKSTGGVSIESEFIKDGKYKVISIGSYSENSTYNDQGIRCRLSNRTKERILNKDDITIILNDKTASGNIIGRALLIDRSDLYVYNQRTERLEINKEKYNPQFIYQLLNAPNIREKIIKESQGNTQIYVNWTRIKELLYYIPTLKEQRRIGIYLKQIDNLITLHQRKHEKLVKIKQSLLRDMFV